MGSVLSHTPTPSPSSNWLQKHLELFCGSSAGGMEAFLPSGCADRAGGRARQRQQPTTTVHRPSSFGVGPTPRAPSCPRFALFQPSRTTFGHFFFFPPPRPSNGFSLAAGWGWAVTGAEAGEEGAGGPVRFLAVPSAAAASSAPPTEPPGVGSASARPIRGQKPGYTCGQTSSPEDTSCLPGRFRGLTSCCRRRLLTTSSFFKMATLTLAEQKTRRHQIQIRDQLEHSKTAV